MANNRLYLYDPESHETFLLAKSSGEGWYIFSWHELDDVMGRLTQWLGLKDVDAAPCNCVNRVTQLQLMTEGDLPAGAILNQEVDDYRHE